MPPEFVSSAAPPPAPHSYCTRKANTWFVPGLGGLTKHGKYWYPVCLLHKVPGSIGWRVQWWHGCKFRAEKPELDAVVPESDLVDSLYGDQTRRRSIRLGKWTHAHEIPEEQDVLALFPTTPYTEEIDSILRPYANVLLSIFAQPLEENKRIPAVKYAIEAKKTTVPFTGDLTLLDQSQISNWFYNKIPLAKENVVQWIGCPPHAHAITIVIAARNEPELRNTPGFTGATSAKKQQQELWNLAFSRQQSTGRITLVDVDRECLSLLEQYMFECSDAAGPAGDEQWGLDAGNHQGRWVPYTGLPDHWSDYRAPDEEVYARGDNFSDGSLSDSDIPTMQEPKQPRPKPRLKMKQKSRERALS
ncbi:hypothetical protein B0H10DRAFT_825259 [Mycena sp. CBHHK59/15]|nr:hypothetical protein B0H10DRAFT_825259 [Mycena sp. CBHHK59/15]